MCWTCGTYGGEAHKICWWGNLRARDHLKDVGLDGRIIIKRNLTGICWGLWTGWIWLRIGTSDRLLLKTVKDHHVPPSAETVDSLRNCQLLKNNSASCI